MEDKVLAFALESMRLELARIQDTLSAVLIHQGDTHVIQKERRFKAALEFMGKSLLAYLTDEAFRERIERVCDEDNVSVEELLARSGRAQADALLAELEKGNTDD